MKQDEGPIGTRLPPDVMSRLGRFVDLLRRWNAHINLVGRDDMPHLWERHIADSLQLVSLIPAGLAITDLGTGAGFPGLILAICTDNPVTMIECDVRKASFLREASRETGTTTTICNSRIETANVLAAPIITARALAALPKLLELAFPLLQADGVCLFLKGRNVEDELTAAQTKWHMMIARTPSQTSSDGVVLSLSQIRRLEARQPTIRAGGDDSAYHSDR